MKNEYRKNSNPFYILPPIEYDYGTFLKFKLFLFWYYVQKRMKKLIKNITESGRNYTGRIINNTVFCFNISVHEGRKMKKWAESRIQFVTYLSTTVHFNPAVAWTVSYYIVLKSNLYSFEIVVTTIFRLQWVHSIVNISF